MEEMKGLFYGWLIIMGAIAILWYALPPARAHDHWINEGKYRSPIDGTLCCGGSDCLVLEKEQVKENEVGYTTAAPFGDVIPYREALVSEDSQYHRCHRPDGTLRCFFAPGRGF